MSGSRSSESRGPSTRKARREWLKTAHGFTTNYAWWIAELSVGKGQEHADPDAYLASAEKYVENMFAGKRAALRPMYDRLLKLGLAAGKDAKACPCQTIVPLFRHHVFAQIKPATNSRIDMGFALRRSQVHRPARRHRGICEEEPHHALHSDHVGRRHRPGDYTLAEDGVRHGRREVTRDLHFEAVYPHAIEKVWRAITDPDAIGQWLMKNDFQPRVGHRFQFRAPPGKGWDGIVNCEVLTVEPPTPGIYVERRTARHARQHHARSVAGGTRLSLDHTASADRRRCS